MNAFLVKSEDSGPEEVHSMPEYVHFVCLWFDFLDYLDTSLFMFTPPYYWDGGGGQGHFLKKEGESTSG